MVELVRARDDPADLAAFGWWFASKHLDAAWALAALEPEDLVERARNATDLETMRDLLSYSVLKEEPYYADRAIVVPLTEIELADLHEALEDNLASTYREITRS